MATAAPNPNFLSFEWRIGLNQVAALRIHRRRCPATRNQVVQSPDALFIVARVADGGRIRYANPQASQSSTLALTACGRT